MQYKIIGKIRQAETIASGRGIRNMNRLNKAYGKANWRKLKGQCRIKMQDGTLHDVEVHWYEGHGKGKKEIKIKRYL